MLTLEIKWNIELLKMCLSCILVNLKGAMAWYVVSVIHLNVQLLQQQHSI
jgi:hypothetical protein